MLGLYYMSMERPDQPGPRIAIVSEAALKAGLERDEVVLHDPANPLQPVDGSDVKKAYAALKSGKLTAHRVPSFTSVGEIEHALDSRAVTLHTRISATYHTIDADGKPIAQRVVTTPGRMLLSEILPRNINIGFDQLNRALTKKDITNVIDAVYRHCGQKETVIFADRIMRLGFSYGCRAGISFGKDDLIVPAASRSWSATRPPWSRSSSSNISTA